MKPDYDAMIAALPTKRTCAGCDLCCTAVGVNEIEKPPAVRCEHLCGSPGKSCAIYPDRPDDCRMFVCLWRGSDEALPMEFFPPDCGFVVAFNDAHVFPLVITIHPDPARPDAWDKPMFRGYFVDMAWKLNAVVAIGQGETAHTLFAPSGRVFTKAEHPLFFLGKSVGVPKTEFRSSRMTAFETINAGNRAVRRGSR